MKMFLMDLAAHHPPVTRAITMCSVGVPHVNCLGPLIVAGLNIVGVFIGRSGPQHDWLLGPASCDGCQSIGMWNKVLLLLAAGPEGSCGWSWLTGGRGHISWLLAVGCMGWLWGAERGAILLVHGAGSQDCWYGDQGGPNLVPDHWWAGMPSMIID